MSIPACSCATAIHMAASWPKSWRAARWAGGSKTNCAAHGKKRTPSLSRLNAQSWAGSCVIGGAVRVSQVGSGPPPRVADRTIRAWMLAAHRIRHAPFRHPKRRGAVVVDQGPGIA